MIPVTRLTMKIINYIRQNLSFILISVFWLFALLNPIFKKYDYGAGFPLIISFCILLPFLEFKERNKDQEFSIWEKFFLIVFAISIILSFVFSQTKSIGFSEVLAFLSLILFYFIFAFQKNKWIENFLTIVGYGTYIAVLIGFFIYIFKDDPRMVGPFFNVFYHSNLWPNAFALFLLIVWPIFIFVFKRKWGWLEIIEISFLISALFLSFSRGALIAFAGQIVLLGIYYFRKIKLKSLLKILIVVVLAFATFQATNFLRSRSHVVLNVSERINFDNNEVITSKTERVDFWIGALKLIKEKPFLGWGPFSFREANNPYQKILLGSSDHPHNLFLKIGAENGLIALFAFIAFLVSILSIFIKRFPKLDQRKKDLVYVLIVSIAGALAHSLIDYNFNFFANIFLFFIFLAFIRSLLIKGVRKSNSSIFVIIATIILSIFSVYEGTLFIASETGLWPDAPKYSLYSRDYYIEKVEESLKYRKFDTAISLLNTQIKLNPINAKSYYLFGLIYCNKSYENFDIDICSNYFLQAKDLNPKNEIAYHYEYFKNLVQKGIDINDQQFIILLEQNRLLLKTYFAFVRQNVHFTAYTDNVEISMEFAEFLGQYLDEEEKNDLIKDKNNTMSMAKQLRGLKEY